MQIGADRSAHRVADAPVRIARWRGAVVVEPQDDAGEMGVVGQRAAVLVVLEDRPRTDCRGTARGSASAGFLVRPQRSAIQLVHARQRELVDDADSFRHLVRSEEFAGK